MKVLLIAGHGKKRNGTFDPGASGFLKKGEHKYMTENLFPAMKKHLPAGVQATFHTAYNVYDYGNLATLARGHDSVVECHFDATGNSTASGGHVIVYSGFKPDKMDLALRDAIKNNVGIFSAYKHHGQAGISGRDNLQNVNIAANSGINYRLLELGFGTNKKDADYMLNNVDQYAKDLVQAIFGSAASSGETTTTKPKPQPQKPAKKSIKVIAKEVIDGNWGNGSERKSRLEKAGYNYTTVQNKVNALLGISGGSTKRTGKWRFDTPVKIRSHTYLLDPLAVPSSACCSERYITPCPRISYISSPYIAIACFHAI